MDKVDYVCDSGFRMTNKDLLTCTATEEWGDQVQACIRAVSLSVDILKQLPISPHGQVKSTIVRPDVKVRSDLRSWRRHATAHTQSSCPVCCGEVADSGTMVVIVFI